MADITKMFVHFNGTKQAFIEAGNPAKYTNSIVFINGGTEEKSCIYTHGEYYADAKALVSALRYVSGIVVDGTQYTLPEGGGSIEFVSSDPQTITIDVSNGKLEFGLDSEFTKTVADTEQATKDLRTDLGAKADASTADTAFGKIAKLQALYDALAGDGDESVETRIENAIAALKDEYAPVFEAIDGSIANLDASVKDIDASVDAIFADKTIVKDVEGTGNVDASIVDNKLSISVAGADAVASGESAFVTGDAVYEYLAGEVSKASTEGADVTVTVKTDNGKVTEVKVNDASIATKYVSKESLATEVSGEGENDYVKVKVSTKDGKVSGVEVTDLGVADALEGIDTALKGKADLENGKVVLSQLPDTILGQVVYGGTVDADGKIKPTSAFAAIYAQKNDGASVPELFVNLDAAKCEATYFIFEATYGDYETGDWAISDGANWSRIDNTDAVTAVAGLTGAVTASDLAAELVNAGLATKKQLDDATGEIKVAAAGDGDLIDASAGDGRTITVAPTERLSDAVALAERLGEEAAQSATGDIYIDASQNGTEITIKAQKKLSDAVALAETAAQQITVATDSSLCLDASRDASNNVVIALTEKTLDAVALAESAAQSASGDDYIDASQNGTEITIKAQKKLSDAVALAETAAQSGKVAEDSSNYVTVAKDASKDVVVGLSEHAKEGIELGHTSIQQDELDNQFKSWFAWEEL